ncbi:hypothetical protein LZ554_006649 [Drepanopeziza brunnea f. sp. 'monogermtubi']|nr:hypothetical protein LZ554_006649 [Drepanopeziza brunnea f. sp. 'monogermtubi']
MIARDAQEKRRTIETNTGILVRTYQHLIFARRCAGYVTPEQQSTAPPPLPATFQRLGMLEPYYQVNIMTSFVTKLNAALNTLDEGAQEHQATFTPPPSIYVRLVNQSHNGT